MQRVTQIACHVCCLHSRKENFAMKRLVSSLGLLVAASFAMFCPPAKAAVGTLTIQGFSSNFTVIVGSLPTAPLRWRNTVTLSDPTSKWIGAVAHWDGFTQSFQNVPIGGGTVELDIAFWNYNVYNCYAVDSGGTGIFPIVPWSISTNHIMVTVQ
jgi:hypothetical protein